MASHSTIVFPDGVEFAVASHLIRWSSNNRASVMVPIDFVARHSDQEIGERVRAAVPFAMELAAEHILYDLEDDSDQYWFWTNALEFLREFGEGTPKVLEAIALLEARLENYQQRRAKRRKQKRAVSKKDGFVYLAKLETGHYKIGASKDTSKRIKHFDTIMPLAVETVHVFPADDMLEAERLLHEQFADKRTVGEWFELEPKDVAYIMSITEFVDGCYLHNTEDGSR